MRQYFLFDTETGGLDATKHSLLSFYGMILNHNFETTGEIDLMVKPDDGVYHVDIEALKVNKIDLIQHDKIAIPESKAGDKLLDFLATHYVKSGVSKLIPAGHNIGRLDIPMAERLIGFKNWDTLIVRRTLDTGTLGQMLIAQGKIPESNKGSLVELCDQYGINFDGAHNAKRDVEMCRQLLVAMKNQP
jgi:DNA polymerase III alpha subunit (gram-positive type)